MLINMFICILNESSFDRTTTLLNQPNNILGYFKHYFGVAKIGNRCLVNFGGVKIGNRCLVTLGDVKKGNRRLVTFGGVIDNKHR